MTPSKDKKNKKLISTSEYRRLRAMEGDDWWIDHEAPPNGIGPVCNYCDRLVDWPPRDHAMACPVRRYLRWEDDDES